MPGTLYVVATPIGNLADLTPRAREVLASVALIAAEDTRHTRQLLQSCGIGTRADVAARTQRGQKSAELVARLARGESIALVSDAGTPLVSDPGLRSGRGRAQAKASQSSQFPARARRSPRCRSRACRRDRFAFEGFLPAKTAARSERLAQLAREERTLIFYEAPHRLAEVLRDMARIFGAERRASISRELTKRFETTYSGTLAQLSETAERDSDMTRGELVIVVSGAPPTSAALELDSEMLLRALLEELSPSQAAKIAAHLTGAQAQRPLRARASQCEKKPGETQQRSMRLGHEWCSAEFPLVFSPGCTRPHHPRPESARQSLRASVEESPGSQGKAPGNAWGA